MRVGSHVVQPCRAFDITKSRDSRCPKEKALQTGQKTKEKPVEEGEEEETDLNSIVILIKSITSNL